MVATPSVVKSAAGEKKAGLAFWMHQALEECARVNHDFAADPVHDLRVALRRCRSMADGLMALDPDPAWKKMKKAGKQLFRSLGDLRDMQVMEEWVRRLCAGDDPVAFALLEHLASREFHLKQQAAQALRDFDRKQWKQWSTSLPRHAARLRPGSLMFRHLALERWTEAYALHRRALRNRSQTAWHALRIGLKRLRYMVENFLPEQHAAWSSDLKDLQDLLGEVHDLDVLWATALQIKAFPDAESRSRWHAKIGEERARRIGEYRHKMTWQAGLWQVWRAELPQGKEIESAALSRLKRWAAFLDPDFRHSVHVSRLALQLYDGLTVRDQANGEKQQERKVLQVAALLHDVGLSKKEAGHQKVTNRLVQELTPPLGWNQENLRIAGIVARYHRGALPRTGQKALRGLSPGQRITVARLAGILRLANAFDAAHDHRIGSLQIRRQQAPPQNGFLVIAAQGYSPRGRMAEEIAAARHLLETVYHCPVMVKRMARPKSARQPRPGRGRIRIVSRQPVA